MMIYKIFYWHRYNRCAQKLNLNLLFNSFSIPKYFIPIYSCFYCSSNDNVANERHGGGVLYPIASQLLSDLAKDGAGRLLTNMVKTIENKDVNNSNRYE